MTSRPASSASVDRTASGQRMAFRQKRHEADLPEHLGLISGGSRSSMAKPDARVTRSQQTDNASDRRHVGAKKHIGMVRAECGEGRRHDGHGRRRRSGDPDKAGPTKAKIGGLSRRMPSSPDAMRSASSNSSSASGVGRKRPLVRSKRAKPSSSSVCRRTWLRAGCEMFSVRAAAVIVPARMTAMKHSS